MTDPVWMKWVIWPDCATCERKGFFVDPNTGWPSECTACKTGREKAIKNAQSYNRRELKAGRA